TTEWCAGGRGGVPGRLLGVLGDLVLAASDRGADVAVCGGELLRGVRPELVLGDDVLLEVLELREDRQAGRLAFRGRGAAGARGGGAAEPEFLERGLRVDQVGGFADERLGGARDAGVDRAGERQRVELVADRGESLSELVGGGVRSEEAGGVDGGGGAAAAAGAGGVNGRRVAGLVGERGLLGGELLVGRARRARACALAADVVDDADGAGAEACPCPDGERAE